MCSRLWKFYSLSIINMALSSSSICVSYNKKSFLNLSITIICCCCVVKTTTGLEFCFPKIGPDNQNKDIVMDGDGTHISSEGIQLAGTPKSVDIHNESRAGRATYAKLLHLWDSASGQLADFSTSFTLIADSESNGLSFFLARNTSLVTASGAMGLPLDLSPFVSVEFGTSWNSSWDPLDKRNRAFGDNVGVNIHSFDSVKAKKWRSNVTCIDGCVVNIRYDSASRNLTTVVTVQNNNASVPTNYLKIHQTMDLSSVLPEYVLFGFGALSASSSGDHFQGNRVKSWCFNSTDLDVRDIRGRHNKKGIVIEVISLSVFIVLLALVILIFLKKNMKKKAPNHGTDKTVGDSCSISMGQLSHRRKFTFEDLLQATNEFHKDQILGQGGFGKVYKAVLPDNKMVAVKRISSGSKQVFEDQYKAEVMIAGNTSHRHLVQIIGSCREEQELLIVYEFMENGSLDHHLFNPEMATLKWGVRYKIIQGLSKAVRYLHEEYVDDCVLHMDIKASNLLLDSKFNVKLGDFGLAKLVNYDDRSPEISRGRGTPGYLAPECINGRLGRESDVYSFGVVALEIATGSKAIDNDAQEEQRVLVKKVQNLYKMGKVMDGVDPRLGNDYDKVQMEGLLILGLWCVHQDYGQRPSMRDIVRALDNPQDPLQDFRLKIPTLVPETIPHPFDSILEIPPSIDDNHPETAEPAYPSSLFMWPRILSLYLLRYLLGLTWAQPLHDR